MEMATKLDSFIADVGSQVKSQAQNIESLEAKVADLTDAFAGMKAANDEVIEVKDNKVDIKAKLFEAARNGADTVLIHEGQIKAFNVTDDASAGAAVVTEVSKNIIESVLDGYKLPSMFGRKTVGSIKHEERVLINRAGTGWEGENVSGGDIAQTGTPTFATIRMTSGKAYASPVVTQEALSDPFFDSESYLMRHVKVEMGRTINDAVMHGDGVEKPKGFYKHFGSVRNHETFLAVEAAQGTDEELIAALQGLQFELGTGYLAGAKYIVSRDMFQRIASLRDGLGRPMMQTALDKEYAGSLFGFPIVVDVHASAEIHVVFGKVDMAFNVVNVPTAMNYIKDPYTIPMCVRYTLSQRVGTIVGDTSAVVGLKAPVARKSK